MSENPFGGATSDRAPTPMLPAWAKTTWVSGSAADPGQLVAVDATIAPYSGPAALPIIGGAKGDGSYLYFFSRSSACARSSGVKSIRSSGTSDNYARRPAAWSGTAASPTSSRPAHPTAAPDALRSATPADR